MFQGPFIARFFVFVQLSSLFYLLFSGPWLADYPLLIGLELVGLLLGAVAIWQMNPSNINVTPIPKTGGRLVTHGVYKVIRHPMYLAQLLVVGALVIEHYSHLRLIVLLILLVNLIFKLNYEETHLVKHFEGYEKYRQSSWRLIPLIY
jgi:protein-S-isoprenylcysteine O-methyltransferase Ste14